MCGSMLSDGMAFGRCTFAGGSHGVGIVTLQLWSINKTRTWDMKWKVGELRHVRNLCYLVGPGDCGTIPMSLISHRVIL